MVSVSSRRLGLETYQRLVSVSSREKLSTSRTRPIVSCPRPIFGQLLQATLLKRTQCERASNTGGSKALTFFYQLSALSKSCYYHIRELRCLRPYLDFKTASTIATSIVHSKLYYCNSLYYNLPQSQIKKNPEHPDLSCSCCYQNAKIFSYHSCSEISTLAENKRMH